MEGVGGREQKQTGTGRERCAEPSSHLARWRCTALVAAAAAEQQPARLSTATGWSPLARRRGAAFSGPPAIDS